MTKKFSRPVVWFYNELKKRTPSGQREGAAKRFRSNRKPTRQNNEGKG